MRVQLNIEDRDLLLRLIDDHARSLLFEIARADGGSRRKADGRDVPPRKPMPNRRRRKPGLCHLYLRIIWSTQGDITDASGPI